MIERLVSFVMIFDCLSASLNEIVVGIFEMMTFGASISIDTS